MGLGVLLPTFMFLPLKPASATPDPASPGSFGIVLMQAVAGLIVTIGTGIATVRVLAVPLWQSALVISAAATVTTGLTLLIESWLATAQHHVAFAACLLWGCLLLGLNLWALAWSGGLPADSVNYELSGMPLFVVAVLAVPLVGVLVLLVIGIGMQLLGR